MQIVLLLALSGLSFTLTAATPDVATSMVPRGKLFEQIGRDYIVKSPAGTKIEIEFNRTGILQKAKGRNLNKGDELEPGEGLLSLGSVAQLALKAGKKPEGPWILDNDKKWGWVYEFDHLLISAKDGKIIQEKTDLPKVGRSEE